VQTVTVTNPGSSAVTVSSISVSGAFAQTSTYWEATNGDLHLEPGHR